MGFQMLQVLFCYSRYVISIQVVQVLFCYSRFVLPMLCFICIICLRCYLLKSGVHIILIRHAGYYFTCGIFIWGRIMRFQINLSLVRRELFY